MSHAADAAGPKKAAPSALTLVAVIFWPLLFLGTIAIAYGLKLWVDQRSFLRTAVHAQGTVVGLDHAPSGGHTPTYHPIVRYAASGGASVQFVSRFAYSQETYQLQQAVDVLYDPADPKNAEVDSNQFRYRVFLLPAFGAGLGVMAVGAYFVLHVIQRLFLRQRRAVPHGE
jgi:Protein of unknown function (DUF3592)